LCPVDSSRNSCGVLEETPSCAPVRPQAVRMIVDPLLTGVESTESTAVSTHRPRPATGSVSGLGNPRGVRVESSRIPRVVHDSVHMCEQPGESGGTTRGALEDEWGTNPQRPQPPSVHPRVTQRSSPPHHAPGPADSAAVHRFHSAYYYFSSPS